MASFADFPRVCRFVAEDGFLPYSFATRGRRLVYSEGIWVLAILAATLFIVFNGVTDKLIPLFAVGAFLAFTLSQAGMVVHWLKSGGRGSRVSPRDFASEWDRNVRDSIECAGLPEPELVVLESPYRKVISPILDYIWKLERENPADTVAVLIPQLIETHWYYSFLHNQRATILRSILLLKGQNRIVIINVPWRIEESKKEN
jgi:amino acid transporter